MSFKMCAITQVQQNEKNPDEAWAPMLHNYNLLGKIQSKHCPQFQEIFSQMLSISQYGNKRKTQIKFGLHNCNLLKKTPIKTIIPIIKTDWNPKSIS